jgi:quercetin dioxygenase-like cupin family protein
MKKVDKPWGFELIWAHTDKYVGKILFVKAGEALSLQYHRKKDETIYLFSGELDLLLEEKGELKKLRVHPGDAFRILPGVRHRMIAVKDSEILEASTPELDDVVRLEDRYKRDDKEI